jgi:hypothetical protein
MPSQMIGLIGRLACQIDILSDLKDGDSFCKTAMSRREDILSCIDVTIMDRSANTALTPGEPNFPMLPATSRILLCNLLDGLYRQIQGAFATGSSVQELPKVEAGQKAPFTLEYLERKFVTVIKDRVDLAGQIRKPRRMLVLDPQVQDSNGSQLTATVHAYSIATRSPEDMKKNAPNQQKWISLSLAGLNAGVSRERG